MKAWALRQINPVAVKELRGAFRGSRYLIAHMVIVSLCALGMFFLLFGLIVEFESRFGPADPTFIGVIALHASQVTHLAVVFLVVPAFAATALSTERERQTLDLMLATGLKARSIVWGKFVAAMMLTGLLFVALMPLVSLCFLFGGVTVYQIMANYVFLAMLAALLVVMALAVSAGSPGTARAVITTYVASGFVALAIGVGAAALFAERVGLQVLEVYGFVSPQEVASEFRYWMQPDELEQRQVMVAGVVLPSYAWLVAIGFFFLMAVNRLKPHFANQSTGVRIYYLIAAVGLTAVIFPVTAWAFDADLRPGRDFMITMAMIVWILGTLSCFFALENPFLPVHTRRLAEAAEKRGWHRWMFHPGSRTGVVFVMTANGIALAFLVAWWFSLAADQPGALASVGVGVGAATLWLWVASAVAAMISGFLGSRPLASRIIFIIFVAMVAVLPVVHVGIEQLRLSRHLSEIRSCPVTAVFSPIIALFAGFERTDRSPTFPVHVLGEIYIPMVFSALAGAAGLALNTLARRRYWSRVRQEQHELSLLTGEK